ncbi:hypothetical protein ACOME3_001141 [Neoechinorhynchus agilis]
MSLGLAFLLFLCLATSDRLVSSLHPVILIPGYAGSQIDARLKNNSANGCTCPSHWFTLWLDVRNVKWPMIDSFVDRMRLVFDRETGKTRNVDGLQIRVPGFGDTSTVEYLSPHKPPFSSYFGSIVELLVEKL